MSIMAAPSLLPREKSETTVTGLVTMPCASMYARSPRPDTRPAESRGSNGTGRVASCAARDYTHRQGW